MKKYLKAVTFSYDDGVRQDRRLIDVFDRYGLKATFNLNSALLGKSGELVRDGVRIRHDKNAPEEVRDIYKNHEVASHTLTHPFLLELADEEVIRQVEDDRLALSELCGKEVVGFAYPGGGINFNERVAKLIAENTGIRYCRTTVSTGKFDVQSDLTVFKPTVYHHAEFEKMEALADEFLALKPEKPQVFYIWGHAYEFDIRDEWERMARFCEKIGGKDDIFYGTNREVLLEKEWMA